MRALVKMGKSAKQGGTTGIIPKTEEKMIPYLATSKQQTKWEAGSLGTTVEATASADHSRLGCSVPSAGAWSSTEVLRQCSRPKAAGGHWWGVAWV